ncbi:MAG TPA: alpha/beta hydrolase [Blastocatellia bacterium]|nr:alpha/beta hydrolase [Blastocatellia bacterium]
MPLDPQIKSMVDMVKMMEPLDLGTVPVGQTRAAFKMLASMGGAGDPMQKTEDLQIPGPGGDIKARVYRPLDAGTLPALVFFHGGGWVIGAIETHEGLCKSLASRAGCAVISVDYRLAPENKFPAGLEDCYAAARWVQDHADEIGLDALRIGLGGDDAGGNLAAAVSIMLRDKGEPMPRFQLLIYPVTDYCVPSKPSLVENGEGYLLTSRDMVWFFEQYLNSAEDGTNALVSPLRAERLDGLPPALVITAEFDPLRDEGEMYAARLRDCGVTAETRRYDGMIHAFLSLSSMSDRARKALNETGEALKSALA